MAQGVCVDIDIRNLTDQIIGHIAAAVQAAPGQKKPELMLNDPSKRLSIEMFSRKYRIDPKTFIQKVKENNICACKRL